MVSIDIACLDQKAARRKIGREEMKKSPISKTSTLPIQLIVSCRHPASCKESLE
jgi:hypothetical protein